MKRIEMRSIKKSIGLTLVEVIIGVTLLSGILFASVSLLKQGIIYNKVFDKEFNFQSGMRDAMEMLEMNIKASYAVFSVPEKMYKRQDDKWNYIGIGKIGSKYEGQIVEHYTDKNGNRVEKPLTQDMGKVHYEIFFELISKVGYSQKLLSFTIRGIPLDKKGNKIYAETRELSTTVEAINSYAVVDKSTPEDPSVSIAYRKDKRDPPAQASITIVADVSAWMKHGMDGNLIPKRKEDRRINHVVNGVNDILKTFQDDDNIYVKLIKFGLYGTYSKVSGLNVEQNGYLDLKKNKDHIDALTNDLFDEIDVKKKLINYSNLADGFRVGYIAMNEFARNKGHGFKGPNHLIVITCGLPSVATAIDGSILHPYLGNVVAKNTYDSPPGISVIVAPTWWDVNTPKGTYIGRTLNMMADKYARPGSPKYVVNTRLHLIKVGETRFDVQPVAKKLQAIATMYGSYNQGFYDATNPEILKEALESIKKEIKFDMWYINGPK